MSRLSRSTRSASTLKTALFVALALAVAAIIGFVASRGDRPAPETAAPQAPAPQAPAAKTTGSYADDWQSMCGALQGDAQAACTKRLDGAYGRSDDAPVPPAK